MTNNIKVNADTKHLIAVAAIWKSPELVKLWAIGAFFLFFVMPFLGMVHKNIQEDGAQMQQFQEKVKECQSSMYQRIGYSVPVTQASEINLVCRRWANTQIPLYENI